MGLSQGPVGGGGVGAWGKRGSMGIFFFFFFFFPTKNQHQDDEGIMQWWAKQETENSKHSDVDDDSACADVPVVP